jgi:predicted TIM-barrel fold metal-dependent hydrolase
MEATNKKNLVIDGHCHIASNDFLPDSFAAGVIENINLALMSKGIRTNKEKLRKMYLSKFQDPLCDDLVKQMDDAGIDKSVLLAADFTYALKDESRISIEEILIKHKEILERHPDRFYVFSGMDPRWGQKGLDLFEKSIREFGFHGFKIYPPCGYSPSDPLLYPFYEICQEWGIPVLSHVGGTNPVLSFETAAPVFLDKAARDFPNVDFILAHGTVSYVEECAMMCSFRPNVYLDISGYQTEDIKYLSEIMKRGYRHKIIFGTDWPLFRLQGTQKNSLDKILAMPGPLEGLSPAEVDSFLGGTLARLLSKRKTQ